MDAVALPPRLIAGTGTSESAWKVSPQLAAAPCHPLDWWLTQDTRLVVLAPHPDDEVLACGALLQQHANRGGECLVIAATDGEASHPPTPQRSTSQLALTRQAETRKGLNRLGLGEENVVRLGLPDGQVQGYLSNLCSALEICLRPTDLLVTTYQLDGHPDHEACGSAAVSVCSKINCRLAQAPVWLWHWAGPNERLVPWHRLQGFRVPPASRALKLQALSEHVSQIATATDDGAPILEASILERAQRDVEYFFV